MAEPKLKEVEVPKGVTTVFIVVEDDGKGKLQRKLMTTELVTKDVKDAKATGPVAFYGKNKREFKFLAELTEGTTLVVPKENTGLAVVMPDTLNLKPEPMIFPTYKDNHIAIRNESEKPVMLYNLGHFQHPKMAAAEVRNTVHVEKGAVEAFTQKDGRIAVGLTTESVSLNPGQRTATVNATTRVQPYRSPVAKDKNNDSIGIFKFSVANGNVGRVETRPFVSVAKNAQVTIKGPDGLADPFTLKGNDAIDDVAKQFSAYRATVEKTKFPDNVLDYVNAAEPDINKKKFTKLDIRTFDLEFDKEGKGKFVKPVVKPLLDLKKEKGAMLVPANDPLRAIARDAVTFAPVETDSGFNAAVALPRGAKVTVRS